MVKNVRMSRKVHEVPRVFNEGHHPRGKAGNTGLDNGQDLKAPAKTGAFKSTNGGFDQWTPTPVPKSAEDVDHSKEGPRHLKAKGPDHGS